MYLQTFPRPRAAPPSTVCPPADDVLGAEVCPPADDMLGAVAAELRADVVFRVELPTVAAVLRAEVLRAVVDAVVVDVLHAVDVVEALPAAKPGLLRTAAKRLLCALADAGPFGLGI